MADRNIRNLVHLQATASTSRVLNLLAVERANRGVEGWAKRPLFANPHLNRAIIIKHRLRRDELDLFPGRRQVVTKIVMPIDPTDLKLGGRFVFVGQTGFRQIIDSVFGCSMPKEDLDALFIIDKLPSLDPFLLREQFRRHGRDPDACYFELTEADRTRMFAFAQSEIAPLVAMSLGRSDDVSSHAAVLVSKILSNADGEEMEPLRQTLRLAPDEYAEGAFCWKGFLYYKWSLSAVIDAARAVPDELASIRPVGAQDLETRAYISKSRDSLQRKIRRTLESVSATLKVYDDAYGHLTNNGRPTAFREFLLDAPLLFTRLGDQVGALQHIVSFWKYRFGAGAPAIGVSELIDVLYDFETSLTERNDPQVRSAQAA